MKCGSHVHSTQLGPPVVQYLYSFSKRFCKSGSTFASMTSCAPLRQKTTLTFCSRDGGMGGILSVSRKLAYASAHEVLGEVHFRPDNLLSRLPRLNFLYCRLVPRVKDPCGTCTDKFQYSNPFFQCNFQWGLWQYILLLIVVSGYRKNVGRLWTSGWVFFLYKYSFLQ